jgi:acyl-coenzyme A thioesterase PaaI-like protein
VQFHPESIGTPSGVSMMQNFLGSGAEQQLVAVEGHALELGRRLEAA